MDELVHRPLRTVSRELASTWQRIGAAVYDPMLATAERRGMAQRRRRLLAGAHGTVVEIGAGTGLNLPHYPSAAVTSLVLTEPVPAMASHLRSRAAAVRPDAEVVHTTGDRLPAASGTVDTVVGTLVLCTVPDPDAVLAEIARVLRPGGQFLFCEHVRSDDPATGRWQDRLAGPWAVFGQGCRCNRRTLSSIEAAFGDVESDPGTWQGMPMVVRPLVTGRAVHVHEARGRAAEQGEHE